MEKKAVRKGLERNDAAGNDLHSLGGIQAGAKNCGQVRTDEGFSAFQADELYPSKAGERGNNGLPLAGGELRLGFPFDAAVPALKWAPGRQGNIQRQFVIQKMI